MVMKKTILMLFVAMLTVSVSAQRFGVKAGLNLSNYYGSDADGFKTLTGFQLGGLYELPLSGGFYLQPEAVLTLKGAKYTLGSSDLKMKPYYLEIPVRAMYKLPVGSGNLTLATGPYLALGLFGKGTYAGDSGNLFTKEGGAEATLKRFDLGLSSALGYELSSGLFFNLESSLGFLNTFNADGNVKNTTVALVVGHKF
jgi:hypothetical protein